MTDLLVDLNGFIVVTELSRVLRHFEHALIRGRVALLALEVIRRLLVMLDDPLQVDGLRLVDLRDRLMMLRRHRKPTHVCVDLDRPH